MGDIFGIIMLPVRSVIEVILVAFHWLFTNLGMNGAWGLTWVLSIICLVLVIRSALIPLFVKQIKNQRVMMQLGPEMKKIQEKYRGKKDQYSREAMQRETMALYSKHGTSPFSSCLPMLVQIPVFFGLYSVLLEAAHGKAGVWLMNLELADQFSSADFFGAPLSRSFWQVFNEGGPWQTLVLAPVMVVLMSASQFFTQYQLISYNMSEETKASPTFRMQRIMMYMMPLVFLISGVAFPVGVMFYWLTTNIWTMAQQFVVIRNMPTPNTPAYRAWQARQQKKAERKGIAPVVEEIEEKPTEKAQRQQPISKARAKKQQGKRK